MSGNGCYFGVVKHLKSKRLSRKTKILQLRSEYYSMLVKAGRCDQRAIADQRLITFEKKVYVFTICGQNVNPGRSHMEGEVTSRDV